jgi:hypothetical protein
MRPVAQWLILETESGHVQRHQWWGCVAPHEVEASVGPHLVGFRLVGVKDGIARYRRCA